MTKSPRDDRSDRRQDRSRCNACGWTEKQLHDEKRLGCPACYQSFWSVLENWFENWPHITDSIAETSTRTYEFQETNDASVDNLNEELSIAVATEDYERAADLRDLIRKKSE